MYLCGHDGLGWRAEEGCEGSQCRCCDRVLSDRVARRPSAWGAESLVVIKCLIQDYWRHVTWGTSFLLLHFLHFIQPIFNISLNKIFVDMGRVVIQMGILAIIRFWYNNIITVVNLVCIIVWNYYISISRLFALVNTWVFWLFV